MCLLVNVEMFGLNSGCFLLQDCSFPAYFYTQPMATGPGFYDNLCPQSWQDGSAATWTLQDPHQQSKFLLQIACGYTQDIFNLVLHGSNSII